MNQHAVTAFEKAPVPKAVLQNAIPAMAAMLMVLIYNLADTFFIAQTRSDILVAAVSLATPVFLIFMAAGSIFGIGGTSVISRAFGQGRWEYAKKVFPSVCGAVWRRESLCRLCSCFSWSRS